MKYSAGIIAALAVLICQNEASSVDDINNLLTKSRSVSTSVQSLMIMKTEQEHEKLQQILLSFSQSFENASAEIERTKDYVRKELSPEVAERCKKTLNSRFSEIYGEYVDSLKKCKDSALHSRTTEEIANKFGNVGKALEARIENIKSNCSDPNFDVSEQCLQNYLPELKLDVYYYERSWVFGEIRLASMDHDRFSFNFDYCLSVLNKALRNKLESERIEGVKCDSSSSEVPNWLPMLFSWLGVGVYLANNS